MGFIQRETPFKCDCGIGGCIARRPACALSETGGAVP